jgi:hypothetical protein
VNRSTADVYLNVDELDVRFNGELPGGRSFCRITPTDDPIAVHLVGTPEDFGRLADMIVSATSRNTIESHERAARRAAAEQDARGIGFVQEMIRAANVRHT